jgi:hypothetical protein
LVCSCRADSPRGGGRRSARAVFVECSSCSFSPSFSIHCVFEFWLGEVSDGPRVPGGQSAGAWRTVRVLPADGLLFGSLLEVLFAFSDSPRLRARRSAVRVRTVRGNRPDSPRGLCGQSVPPGRTVRQSLAALFLGSIPPSFLSCFRVCFKESFLRLEVDPEPCCLGDWCVIRSIARV